MGTLFPNDKLCAVNLHSSMNMALLILYRIIGSGDDHSAGDDGGGHSEYARNGSQDAP